MSTPHSPLAHRALFTAAALLLTACASTDGISTTTGTTGSGGGAPEQSLDDALRACAGGEIQYGLDVSEGDGHIDWAAVAKGGEVFALARVGDGLYSPDGEFSANWAGIAAAGLYRGAYQYFRPGQDPIKQADILIAAMGPRGDKDLPPVIEVVSNNGQSADTVVSGVNAWIARVKEKTGRDPVIYTTGELWGALQGTESFATYALWIEGEGATCPPLPSTWSTWSLLRYDESGSVAGASEGVGLDVFRGTLDDLAAFAGGASLLPLGAACTSDEQCGADGQERVCSSADHVCIAGCHEDADCPSGKTCDHAESPWACGAPKPVNDCPVLAFPSGIHVQTVKDAATTKSYENHLGAGQEVPTCFLDVDNLHDPVANTTYDIGVKVAAHFQLVELVGTEIDQGYGHFVLMRPEAVASLEAFRVATGGPVSVVSGFRSPKHQEDVCNDLCGNPLGCPGTCANNSRHMWGDAFDLPLNFYSQYYSDLACEAGFKFVYLESGTHLHVDQNPAYASCVQQ
ncbi:MAG: GH25 family lysozyme [Byssovorax sp.]